MSNMKNKIQDYLHLYLGCECKIYGSDDFDRYWIRMVNETGLSICTDIDVSGKPIWWKSKDCKPILRPLSDMTEEEARYYVWLNMDSEKHLPDDSRIDIDEIDSGIIWGDGGNLVSEGVFVIEVACRCFEGQFSIDEKNGDTRCWDENDTECQVEHTAENMRYLISCGFDLFGLIESGLAIGKTKLK